MAPEYCFAAKIPLCSIGLFPEQPQQEKSANTKKLSRATDEFCRAKTSALPGQNRATAGQKEPVFS